jgi:Flp pilus assembly protein TadB
VNRRLLLTDVAIAAVVAILVLVLTPGLAIAGVLALLVLLVYGVSFGIGRWRRRSKHERALRRFPR